MSIRIALDQAPAFYTNLDFVQGRVILSLNRPENVGNIVVKLEGECKTAVTIGEAQAQLTPGPGSSDIVSESHKLLYLVEQVYPNPGSTPSMAVGAMPGIIYPGQHEFPFKFKVPLNNICANPTAMSRLNGIGGLGASNSGFLGFGGFRTMDGSKQLMLQHVRATLPPSLTGFPRKAEVRYFVKVTIQRPGFFKENWRYQIGFKFLPIEAPRPPVTGQEAYARRPFIFKPQTPIQEKRRNSFFGSNKNVKTEPDERTPPKIEMSARLPHPSILTCNQSIPLKLVAKKIAPSKEKVYLTHLEIALLGYTNIRVYDHQYSVPNRWVVYSAHDLSIEVSKPDDEVDSEIVIPDYLWSNRPLPNTVAPSFTACNLSRRYEVEVRIHLSWGNPGKSGKTLGPHAQTVYLPLKLSKIEVFSGIAPPAELLKTSSGKPAGPPLPPRRTSTTQSTTPAVPADPLYPPQLGPGNVPQYDDAPPSYDEAMAQELAGPQERPAYSGITAENDPSIVPPEKSGLH